MIPLSEKLRPQNFNEIVGQDHLIGKDGWITKVIQTQKPFSILFYGPPGCGKTTIAKLYAKAFSCEFASLSAVFSGIADLKKIIQTAKERSLFNKYFILFVDEIHRFNKAQQDAFLPFIEDGTIILVGATTENPSFSLNSALLSRLRVLELFPLHSKDLQKIIEKFEKKSSLELFSKAKELIIYQAGGDARYLLNLLENLPTDKKTLDVEEVQKYLQKKKPFYDKQGDYHHKLISALHKSVRGSDPDASLYWLARMLNAGEDPLYIARRFIRMAIEDIGLADPEALSRAQEAYTTYHLLGSPEGELALAQTAVYLALSPKSNRIYDAFNKAKDYAEKTDHLSPPPSIINASTKLMKNLGYGEGYIYDHDTKYGFSGQNYFPDNKKVRFYYPQNRGFEKEMQKRIDFFQKLKEHLSVE